MKCLNLNSVIKVHLNETGKQIIAEREKKLLDLASLETKKLIEGYYTNKIDEEGFLTIEFWQFMNIFGQFLDAGSSQLPISSMNILIQEKDLEDHEKEKSL